MQLLPTSLAVIFLLAHCVVSDDLDDFPDATTHGRKLNAIRCKDAVIRDGLFTGIIVTDEVWQKAERSLQRLVDCMPDKGTLVFNVSKPITPRTTTNIEKSIVFTTMEAKKAREESMGKTVELQGGGVEIVCPGKTLIDVQTDDVTIEHISISQCNLPDSAPVIFLEGRTRLSHITLSNTTRSSKEAAPFILTSRKTDITIQNSTFTGNIGSSVLSFDKKSVGLLENVFFLNNSVRTGESAITVEEGELEILNGNFVGNVGGAGGAIHAVDSAVKLKDCEFDGNEAETGGAVHVETSESGAAEIFISSSSFSNCVAQSTGGALHLSGTITEASVKGSSFQENRAQTAGGGLRFEGQGGLEIQDCDFDSSSATERGGMLDVTARAGEIASVTLAKTQVIGSMAKEGGAVHLDGDVTLEVKEGVNFEGNSAESKGGAIFVEDGASVKGKEATFIENDADSGGAICIENGLVSTAEQTNASASLSKVEFIGNTAENGGAISLQGNGTFLTLSNKVTLSKNNAKVLGGGIAASDGSTLKISGTEFLNNNAQVYGGGISIEGLDGIVVANLTDCVFSENDVSDLDSKVVQAGGGISVKGSAVVGLKRLSVRRNSAGSFGGGIYVQGIPDSKESDWASVSIQDSQFLENSAPLGGGGAFLGNTLCSFTGINDGKVSFTRNSADSGGALYIVGGNEVVGERIVFSENTASKAPGGGAIRVEDTKRNSTLFLCAVDFIRNRATIEFPKNGKDEETARGGAVYASGRVDFSIKDVEFSGNVASGDGGSIKMINGAEIAIEDIRFTGICSRKGLED